MIDRLQMVMEREGLTAGKFAAALGVQPSAISHILSGRNKPGYDIMCRFAMAFPAYNLEWLLIGKQPMIKEQYADIATIAPINSNRRSYGAHQQSVSPNTQSPQALPSSSNSNAPAEQSSSPDSNSSGATQLTQQPSLELSHEPFSNDLFSENKDQLPSNMLTNSLTHAIDSTNSQVDNAAQQIYAHPVVGEMEHASMEVAENMNEMVDSPISDMANDLCSNSVDPQSQPAEKIIPQNNNSTRNNVIPNEENASAHHELTPNEDSSSDSAELMPNKVGSYASAELMSNEAGSSPSAALTQDEVDSSTRAELMSNENKASACAELTPNRVIICYSNNTFEILTARTASK